MDFSAINYLAVAVAALAGFGLGALWYSSFLFGKSWQQLLGFTDEYLQQGNLAVIFGSSFVAMLVMSLGLGLFISNQDGSDFMTGFTQGIILGVFFVATSTAINYLYQHRTWKLWAIDAGYQVLMLGLMGGIIGAWQ